MELGVIFLIGFLSSFGHCIGMCGGFVAAYTMKLNASQPLHKFTPGRSLTPHLLYNAGRLLTYVFLGMLFGLVGETMRIMVGIKQYQGFLQLLAGLLMILIALDMGGWIPPLLSDRFPGYRQFKNLLGRLFNRVTHRNVFGLGLALGFIPCGLVYAAGAKAASTGTMVDSMLTMLFFGLGTFPALLAVGLSANLISANFRSKVFKFATVLVVLVGLVTTYRGFNSAFAASPPQHGAEIECVH